MYFWIIQIANTQPVETVHLKKSSKANTDQIYSGITQIVECSTKTFIHTEVIFSAFLRTSFVRNPYNPALYISAEKLPSELCADFQSNVFFVVVFLFVCFFLFGFCFCFCFCIYLQNCFT